MRGIIKKHHISFQVAWSGLTWAFSTQPNFRVHVSVSILSIAMGVYFGITRIEMIIIVFTIVLGLASEMINTSLEAVTDFSD